MKKIVILGALAIVSLASCKKDYTCSCTVLNAPINLEYKDMKKSEANDNCSSAETSYRVADANATCAIK